MEKGFIIKYIWERALANDTNLINVQRRKSTSFLKMCNCKRDYMEYWEVIMMEKKKGSFIKQTWKMMNEAKKIKSYTESFSGTFFNF